VQERAIVGHSDVPISHNQFLWGIEKVADFYLSLDVLLETPERNAGIQFRSVKVDSTGQAKGYQADVGTNYNDNVWGTLYHEHGRGLLNGSALGAQVVKPREWNRYEILAVKHNIWIAINGKVVSATRDEGGELSGYIALQIHSGLAQTVRYRIGKLVHDPEVSLAGLNQTALEGLLRAPLAASESVPPFEFRTKDVVAFAGGTNIANMSQDGYLETGLTALFLDKGLRFRNLGWDGDDVYEHFRDVGFGSWAATLDSVRASVVAVQFGQMESLRGDTALPRFIEVYKKLLQSINKEGRRIVVLSPTPFQSWQLQVDKQRHWDKPLTFAPLEKYVQAIQDMAQAEGYTYVNLYDPLLSDSLSLNTYDGIHLTKIGQQKVAANVMKALQLPFLYTDSLEALRTAVIKKNDIWLRYWQPGNWAFLHGDRTEQAFSRHWVDKQRRIFPEEVQQYAPLLAEAEAGITAHMQLVIENFKCEVSLKNNVVLTDNSEAEELASFRLDPAYKIEL
jgi:hypothetical protein